jgi:hypothetical protein
MSNTTTNPKPNLVVFLDAIGRTILGEPLADQESSSVYKVKNPVVLNVAAAEGGRMSVQLFPLFFREFLGDKSEDVVFEYSKSLITLTSIEAIDFRLAGQYAQLFNKNNVFVPAGSIQGDQAAPSQDGSKVVNLFEE